MLNRRHFLLSGLSGSLGFAIQAASTGLPLSMLMNNRAMAYTESEMTDNYSLERKFCIISASAAGEAIGSNGPDTYGERPGAISGLHPHLLGSDTRKVIINGVEYNASHLSTPAVIKLGKQDVTTASIYRALPEDFCKGLSWVNYRSSFGGHNDFPRLLTLKNTLRGPDGRGVNTIATAIAHENFSSLGTVYDRPISVAGGGYSPTSIKKMMEEALKGHGSVKATSQAYDFLVSQYQTSARTPAQKAFIAENLKSKKQALAFQEELLGYMDDITDDAEESQLKTAVALFRANITPVVVVKHNFSGDNHGDGSNGVNDRFEMEVPRYLNMVKALASYWDALKNTDIRDKVVYATFDGFGRGFTGGRGHYGDSTAALLHGGHLNGGLVGRIEPHEKKAGKYAASGIDRATGLPGNDISPEQTVYAYFKTVMAATGIPSSRCNIRIPDVPIIESVVV